MSTFELGWELGWGKTGRQLEPLCTQQLAFSEVAHGEPP